MAHPRPAPSPHRATGRPSPSVTVVVPARDRADATRAVPRLARRTDHRRRRRRRLGRPRRRGRRVPPATAPDDPCVARSTAAPARRGPRRAAERGHRPDRLRRQRLHRARRMARRAHLAVRRSRRSARSHHGCARRPAPPAPTGTSSTGSAGPTPRSTSVPTRARWGPTGPSATSPPRPWWSGAPRSRPSAGSTRGCGSARTSTWSGGWSTAGWRVRYDPSVTVAHQEPDRWTRPARPAVPLRHVGRAPWPSATRGAWPRSSCARVGRWPPLALLAGRPVVLGRRLVATSAVPLARKVRPLGIPARQAWRWSCRRGRLDGDGPGPGRHHAGRSPGLLALGRLGAAGSACGGGAGAGAPRWWTGSGSALTWTSPAGWPPRWPTTSPTGPGCGSGCLRARIARPPPAHPPWRPPIVIARLPKSDEASIGPRIHASTCGYRFF